MSRAAIFAARERLRDAGRALRARQRDAVVDELAAVLDAWRDPKGRWQRALCSALPRETGFSEPTVHAGLALALEHWSGDALRALVSDELGIQAARSRALGYPLTAVLLAGAIPMPTLLQLLLPLVLRSPVLAKPAGRDPVTAGLVAESLRAEAPALADCLEVVTFDARDEQSSEAFFAADCVVATGSDETITAVGRYVGPTQRLVAYGHRLSVAVADSGAVAGALARETARALSLDVALWDQLGCLSPIAIYVLGGELRQLEGFACELALALEERERELPRGAVGAATAAAIQYEREEARFRIAARAGGALHASLGSEWTVVLEADAQPRSAPLHRFVRVHAVADRSSLIRAIAPFGRHLAAVALSDPNPRSRSETASALVELGASRVCPAGRLQAPALDWPHDGRPLLLPLARLSTLEAPAG